jgi:hypothetical protein
VCSIELSLLRLRPTIGVAVGFDTGTTTDKEGGLVTRQITPQMHSVQVSAPPQTENPQLDERLWRAWIEKNEKRDKVKLVRRVKVIAILLGLLALAALVQRVAG